MFSNKISIKLHTYNDVFVCFRNKRRNARGSRPFKSTWLVTPKENWPPVSKTGIYMSVEPTPTVAEGTAKHHGMVWFRFEHNASYRAVQNVFMSAVESLDSDNIIKVINTQPYHVDSLIQLSELCKLCEHHKKSQIYIYISICFWFR